jgi:hypothetical protein
MGDTMTRHDDGDGRHSNGKGQHGDMRHDDGDRRQHGDGKGQQGGRRYNDTTVTGDTIRQHNEGDARRTTTIRYFILVRLAED